MPIMELLTYIAFAVFCILMGYFFCGIVFNVFTIGFKRSFYTRTNNWQFITLAFINAIIIWKLYYLLV